MEIQADPQQGRSNPRDTIDLDQITSNHAWSRYPMHAMSFRNLVEESTNPRTDMLQYRNIAQVDFQAAKDTFSLISNGECVFKIPDTIVCDRTVTHGSADSYYLDDMDVYLNSEPGELKIEDIPLNKRSLETRSFNAFRKRADYFKEHILRRRTGRWVPSRAHEVRHFSEMQLPTIFPNVSPRIRDVIQPAGMPLSCPFVVYYYHRELKEIQDLDDFTELTERQKRLLFCMEFEYYIMFLDCWWKEAVYGGRQFVLDVGSINALATRCASLTTVSGKPVQVILEHMRSAATKSEECHNWIVFSKNEMEESAFVWARHGPSEPMAGEYDANEPSGVTLWCSTENRRISRSRSSCEAFRRGKSLLEKTVTVPDLGRIRGLMPIIKRHGWDRRGNMKLSHLLENLVNLQNCTSGLLDRATWTESNRNVDTGASNERRYICDRRDHAPPSQRYNGRDLVVYRGDRDHDMYSRDHELRTYHGCEDRYGRGAGSSYCQRRGGTEQRRYCDEDRGDGYRYNPHSDRIREDERENCTGRYDEYENRDRGVARNSGRYLDLDDPSRHQYANAYRNDEEERYYSTHNPVSDLQVDVLTDGMRTPAAEASCGPQTQPVEPCANDMIHNNEPMAQPQEINAYKSVENGATSPTYLPSALYENPTVLSEPEQAHENAVPNTADREVREPTRSLTSTPIVVPGPQGLVVVRPGSAVLSRNQHCTPRRSSNISSDVVTGQKSAPCASGTMQHISEIPTGNVPWMLCGDDQRNTARTDSHAKQANAGPEMQDVPE